MPSYNDITDRSNPGGGALVPTEESREIFKEAAQESAVLNLFRRMPILTNQKTIPVMSAMPMAYFIDTVSSPASDTGLIQTTEMAWKNVNMNVADLAVIAPVPRRLIGDVAAGGFNLTEEMRPYLAQAIAKKIDQAVFFGTDKPTVWPTAVAPACISAGNTQLAETASSAGGLHSDVIKLMKTIRQDGFRASAGLGRPEFEFDLMDARDTTGQPLFKPSEATSILGVNGSLLGRPVVFGADGVFPAQDADASDVNLILFDASKHVCGIREELFMTVHSEGVIQDGSGNIVYNLLQQDIVAIRMIMRVGIAVANPVTLSNGTENTRYPGGVLLSVDETP